MTRLHHSRFHSPSNVWMENEHTTWNIRERAMQSIGMVNVKPCGMVRHGGAETTLYGLLTQHHGIIFLFGDRTQPCGIINSITTSEWAHRYNEILTHRISPTRLQTRLRIANLVHIPWRSCYCWRWWTHTVVAVHSTAPVIHQRDRGEECLRLPVFPCWFDTRYAVTPTGRVLQRKTILLI